MSLIGLKWIQLTNRTVVLRGLKVRQKVINLQTHDLDASSNSNPRLQVHLYSPLPPGNLLHVPLLQISGYATHTLVTVENARKTKTGFQIGVIRYVWLLSLISTYICITCPICDVSVYIASFLRVADYSVNPSNSCFVYRCKHNLYSGLDISWLWRKHAGAACLSWTHSFCMCVRAGMRDFTWHVRFRTAFCK